VNSPHVVREAVLAGLGVALGPYWLFEDGLRTGALRRILVGQEAPTVTIHLLYAANRLLSRRAVAFMDFTAAVFSSTPSLHVGRRDELSKDGATKNPPGV